MNKDITKNIRTLKVFYLFVFFGFGSLFPLLSLYLSKEIGLKGYEIGTIMAIGPIVFIFFQPIWGMVSDWSNSATKVLGLTSILAGTLSLGYLAFDQFYLLVVVALVLAVFQSAIVPVSDSIALSYTSKVKVNYGNIRLFGSLGFGIAVYVMGKLSEFPIGLSVIFYTFCVALVVSGLLAYRLPKEKPSSKAKLVSGMKDLMSNRRFTLFLLITFLIFGPNLANNIYYGLFVEKSGGTYAGIGLAFMLAVLTEIPFMRIAGLWIQKFGILIVVLLAAIASLIRWIIYFTEPSLVLIYSLSAIQGLSIGLFIPAGLQYVRDISPVNMSATAITLYTAIGNGLGNTFSTFISGLVFDHFSIFAVYLFFAILTTFGLCIIFWLIKEEKQQQLIVQKQLSPS